MSTEGRNPRSTNLDKMTPLEIVELLTNEEQAVIDAVRAVSAQLALAASKCAEAFHHGARVVYVGAGTSGRIAVMDAAEMPPTFGIAEDRFIAIMAGAAESRAVERAEDDEDAAVDALKKLGLRHSDVVIGLAASGRTPFVLAAIRYARQHGVWTCGIANNAGTPLLLESEHPIFLDTGPEVLTGSTRLKAGTAQKLALNRISTTAMVLSGKVVSNLMVDVKASNDKLKHRCVSILTTLTPLTEPQAWSALEKNGWNVREILDSHRH